MEPQLSAWPIDPKGQNSYQPIRERTLRRTRENVDRRMQGKTRIDTEIAACHLLPGHLL